MSFRDFHEENNPIVVFLYIQKIKDEAAFVRGEPAIKANGLIDNHEWELRGTTLNTGFGQGELKSSPMAGFPLLPSTMIQSSGRLLSRLLTS